MVCNFALRRGSGTTSSLLPEAEGLNKGHALLGSKSSSVPKRDAASACGSCALDLCATRVRQVAKLFEAAHAVISESDIVPRATQQDSCNRRHMEIVAA